MNPKHFLLIAAVERDDWAEFARLALCSLGEVQVTCEREAPAQMQSCQYAMVVIDNAVVASVADTIRMIRSTQPRIRILVATASPTWRRALEALKLGAMDYVDKEQDRDGFLRLVESLLAKPEPPLEN